MLNRQLVFRVGLVLIALLVTDLASPAAAQPARLSIYVVDIRNRPISGVSILTTGPGGTITTNPEGKGFTVLGGSIRIGDPVTLQVSAQDSKRWALLDPLNRVVNVGNSVVNIMLGDPKDVDALKNRALWGRVDAQIVDGRYPKDGNLRQDLAKIYGTPLATIDAGLRSFVSSPGSSVSDQAAAQRLDRLFKQLDAIEANTRETVGNTKEMVAQQREMMADIRELLKRKDLPNDQQQQLQDLQRDNQRLQAELAKAQGGANREAQLQAQYQALRQQYEALIERLNAANTESPGGTNARRGPSSVPSSSGGGGGSAAKSLLGLGAVVGGLAGAVVLVKKYSPHADATFSMAPECNSPCALVASTTTVAFSISNPDTTNFDYKWDLGDRSTDFGTSISHTYFNEGTYTVSVTASPKTSDSTATGAAASRSVTVKSMTGLWRFTSGNSTGSYQITQSGSSVFGQFTVGTTQGSASGTLSNPRTLRITVGFNGDSLDGAADPTVAVVTGNYRTGSTGAIQPFTLTKIQ